MNIIRNKRKIVITAAVTAALAVLILVCAEYLGDCYRADNEAIAAFLPEGTSWKEDPDGTIIIGPENAQNGFIFYPGGKVEHTAYLPLMQAIAEEGILCILVEMPFRLAVLDPNAATGIPDEYPEVEHWYIGGHSLGGAMAAAHAAENTDIFSGLVLLGAYSTADLSGTSLSVLSVFGSEDGVLDREKYEQYRDNLPVEFEEVILAGGCHAGFGMYGAQDGDGTPAIPTEEQIRLTAEEIVGMILAGDEG
ncbi:MAG: alpha/beta hydrolase [Clostridia bacterium]|nr:alpha/beta hydrolase [Clostridia bacterium]